MARKRFTPEQIVAILREAERGAERKVLFRKHGISEQTFYRWKRINRGLGVSEINVIETLDELMTERGTPMYTRSDYGAEFVSKRLTAWLEEKVVTPVFIEPGSSWENGFVESFQGKLRDECLNEELFWSRGEAQVVLDWYRDVYNRERPHRSLVY